MLLIDQTA